MRVLLLMFSVLLFRGVLFGQALMDFDYPILDNTMAFWGDNYDSALLRKNKVESCVQKNQSFYFDHNGRLVKRTPRNNKKESIRSKTLIVLLLELKYTHPFLSPKRLRLVITTPIRIPISSL